ncbi:cell division protein ZapE [Pokkaliibacter sp. CJK22405]|uniref:cell division protein ZapE n=1 Tax=Pokkaliibacter sp. CJK22405 TaxID=3384615 RepID=UPI0039855AAC
MTPLERYKQDLQREDFQYDAAQEMAVKHLQRVFDELIAHKETSSGGLLKRLFGGGATNKEPVKGLYFWGGVGRGKTYLMDTFYECLPFAEKKRLHFHRFMQRVHQDLKALAGTANPLVKIGEKYAAEARVLCFDEFFVTDITDAMILGGLLEQLFSRGVTLVTTSNIVPDGLYKDGLQRARFLPAIALLNKHTEVVNVDSGVDYRLRALEQAELYHSPLDEDAEQSLHSSFCSLLRDASKLEENASIEINQRNLTARKVCDDIVWFEFDELCDGPRSQNDYIELAREFHAIILSNVPVLGNGKDDQARRFINLVDEFYDSGVKLIISAAKPLDELYAGGRLSFEFERTTSRLLEMQSKEYLAREHRT